MGNENSRNTVRPTIMAIEYGCASLGLNVIASRLEANIEDMRPIAEHMRAMGHHRLINLTHRMDEGRVVMPFYAGDGIVTKIIPADYYDETEPVLSMPCITSDTIETKNYKYLINTYPWVPPGLKSRDVVNELREIIHAIDMDYTDGDAHPRNIHTLPDGLQTPVGIDSYMYVVSRYGRAATEELREAWYDYVETLYPIYKDGEIPKQSADTDFKFLSLHDPDAGLMTFDPTQDNPIIVKQDDKGPKKRGFGGLFGSSGSFGLDPA